MNHLGLSYTVAFSGLRHPLIVRSNTICFILGCPMLEFSVWFPRSVTSASNRSNSSPCESALANMFYYSCPGLPNKMWHHVPRNIFFLSTRITSCSIKLCPMDYMRPYINFTVTNELIPASYNFVHTDYEWLNPNCVPWITCDLT